MPPCFEEFPDPTPREGEVQFQCAFGPPSLPPSEHSIKRPVLYTDGQQFFVA